MHNDIRYMMDKIKNFNPKNIIPENKNIRLHNTAILLKNKAPFWIGSVNILDGEIEEVHTFDEAQEHDFHHSFYFSQNQVEKIDQEECMIFWILNGKIESTWTHGSIPNHIIAQLKKQIQIIN
jgi:hypothetical protein